MSELELDERGCVHCNGLAGRRDEPNWAEGRTCRAGVRYLDVIVFPTEDRRFLNDAKLPCFGEGGSCEKFELPSADLLAAEELAIERLNAGLCTCCGEPAERVGTTNTFVCPTTKKFTFHTCDSRGLPIEDED